MSHSPIRLPRWLGTPSPKTHSRSRDGEREDKPAFLVYEWDEHSFAPKPQETRQPAEDVMRRLPERGVVLILGVPGQGKTTLLKGWQDSLKRPTLLGECRSVNKLGEGENILEVMFKKGVNSIQRIQNWQTEQHLVLLVDALDELSANEDWENALADAIRSAAESQTVVMSCRTHVWQDRLERLFRERKVVVQQTHTLLGFTPAEQLEYLKQWADQNAHTQQEAETLAKNLSKHRQLRSLAANALLLELIAPVALEEKLELPASRAEFYEKAIERMWKQKRETRDHAALIPARDRFLRILGLKTLDLEKGSLKVELSRSLVQRALEETIPDKTEQGKLLELLQKVGLLVEANPNTLELRFVHLTFQEYGLAQGLIFGVGNEKSTTQEVSEHLSQTLKNHWNQPSLMPMLAIAVVIAHNYRANVRQAFLEMLDSWQEGMFSALLVGLHLYYASSIRDPETIDLLWERLPKSKVLGYLIARDELVPSEILLKLAQSADSEVLKWMVAFRPGSEISRSLFSTSDPSVLRVFADDPRTPIEFLEKLADSSDVEVRRGLAWNSSTPIKILKELTSSNDAVIHRGLIRNPSTPQAWLPTLESNKNLTLESRFQWRESFFLQLIRGRIRRGYLDMPLRWILDRNPSGLFDVLNKLNPAEYEKAIENLAGSDETPITILEKISVNANIKVCRQLAWNRKTPVDILRKLALSTDEVIHQGLGMNPSFVLEWLLPPPKQTQPESATRGRGTAMKSKFRAGKVDLSKDRWKPTDETSQNTVLFLPSDPSSEHHLRLLRELGKVRQQLRGSRFREKFNLETEELVEPPAVSQALRDFEPSILHFAGHGTEEGKLVWMDEVGQGLDVAVAGLASMIASRRNHRVKCVVLNACFTEIEAKSLLECVPYVVASVDALEDEAAIAFAIGFYQALAGGDDIGEAFNAGLAQIQSKLSDMQEHEKLVLLER